MEKEKSFSLIKSIMALILAALMLLSIFPMAIQAEAQNSKSTVGLVKLENNKCSYTGKEIKPKVIVKNSNNKTLVQGTDYTVQYPKSSKKIGDYKVIVKFKGDYSGSKTLTYQILPQIVKKLSFKQGTKRVKVKTSPYAYYGEEYIGKEYAYIDVEIDGINLSWEKSAGATGYKVYIYKDKKWVTLSNTAKTEYTVKDLTAGKRYIFAVRAYTVVSNKKYFSKTYTSIVAAPRPKCTPLTVKIKNNKAYISWDKRTCSGYCLYFKANDAGYEKINIKDNNKTQYVYNYPNYADQIYIKIRAYTITDTGIVFSDVKTKGQKVTPTVKKTSGGIPLKTVTSKTAKSIVHKWYYDEQGIFHTFFEGKSSDGKKVVVYVIPRNEWQGRDIDGTRYDAYGKIKICEYCGKQMGEKDGMCSGGCAVIFH